MVAYVCETDDRDVALLYRVFCSLVHRAICSK